MNELDTRVIGEFRANRGNVSAPFEGAPMLLLHHTGARTGTPRVTPLVYLPDGEDYAIYASNNGDPTHPAWYYNLLAAPDVAIEVGTDTGTETVAVTAREVTGDERQALHDARGRQRATFADYLRSTAGIRTIPVFRLTPR